MQNAQLLAFKQWFNNLAKQEQLMLLLAAVAITAYLLLVALWQPMSASIDTLQRQNQAAIQSLANVQSLAAQYTQLQQSRGTAAQASGQNLTQLIGASIKAQGLVMKRFQTSSSGDVQLRLENAPFNTLLAWLHQLESREGVTIRDLSISPTNSSGLVNVSVRLRQTS